MYVCMSVCMYVSLLPTPPPSLTYWGLGVMLEPYVRHGVYISGHCGRRHFLGAYYFCKACISFNIQLMTIQ